MRYLLICTLALLLTGSGGCSSDDSSGSSGGKLGGGQQCAPAANASCEKICVAKDCCAELRNCEAKTCYDLDVCYDECAGDDEGCRSECNDKYPGAVQALSDFRRCSDSCDSECADSDGCGLTGDDSCTDSCLNGTCCSQNTACVENSSCVSLNRCYATCSDDACYEDCGNTYPEGVVDFFLLVDCVGSCGCGG